MSLCVDIIVISGNEVLLIKRAKDPFGGMYAYPGGRVEMTDNSLESAARRELLEETGIHAERLEYVKTICNSQRDPRGLTASVIYMCMFPVKPIVNVGSDACDYKWIDIDNLPVLAFDHNSFLSKSKIEIGSI